MGDAFVITETSRGLINSTLEAVITSGSMGEGQLHPVGFISKTERRREGGRRKKEVRSLGDDGKMSSV